MNNELGGTWKEEIVAYFNIISQHLPGSTKETRKMSHVNQPPGY